MGRRTYEHLFFFMRLCAKSTSCNRIPQLFLYLQSFLVKAAIIIAIHGQYSNSFTFRLRLFCFVSDILINELRVAFIARITSYESCLLYKLRVTFCTRVTSYCLLQELRVFFYIRVPTYCLFHDLRVTFTARVTSCLLHE